MPDLFKHENQTVWVTLVVDDSGIKHIGKEHALHLLSVLKKHCNTKEDWMGSLNCRIPLNWHYDEDYLDISMSNCVAKQLAQYK